MQKTTKMKEWDVTALCGELLIAFQDLDDDDWIPVCAFMRGVGRLQGLSVAEVEDVVRSLPPWETVGWFRERIRENVSGCGTAQLFQRGADDGR